MSFSRNLFLSSSLPMTFVGSLCSATLATAGDRDFPANYQSQDGCTKQEYLWDDRIEPSTYTRLPAVTGS